jgi:hypothetical protein
VFKSGEDYCVLCVGEHIAGGFLMAAIHLGCFGRSSLIKTKYAASASYSLLARVDGGWLERYLCKVSTLFPFEFFGIDLLRRK